MNSHNSCLNCEVYVVQVMHMTERVPHPALQMYFEVQPSSTAYNTDRGTVPYAQHITNKLLMTMHYLSACCDGVMSANSNFQSWSPRCTKYVPA